MSRFPKRGEVWLVNWTPARYLRSQRKDLKNALAKLAQRGCLMLIMPSN